MKKIILLACVALTFTGYACKPKAQSSMGLSPDSLETKTFVFNSDTTDTTAQCKLQMEYPVGNSSLSEAVRKIVAANLDSAINFLGYSEDASARNIPMYKGQISDGQKYIDAYGKLTVGFLKKHWTEDHDPSLGNSYSVPYFTSANLDKIADTKRFVTYSVEGYFSMGGAHGMGYRYGVTVDKATCREIPQLLDTTKVKAMQPLLRRGIIQYFKDFGEEVADSSLKDMLFIDKGIIPLPTVKPYLTEKGIEFVYQPYEIGPYAMGIVRFTISPEKLKPYLKFNVNSFFK